MLLGQPDDATIIYNNFQCLPIARPLREVGEKKYFPEIRAQFNRTRIDFFILFIRFCFVPPEVAEPYFILFF